MTIKGIDIASHQGANFPFAKARQQGFEFAIIKGAGGHTYQNEYLSQQVAGARAAGMLVGFYHYQFEPTNGGGDVGREFANFRDAIKPHWRPGDTIWLDVEEYPRTVGYTGSLGDWIVTWCDLAEREFGIVPGIYCATWFLVPTGLTDDARLRKYPFWMASWQDALPPKAAMKPWDRVTLWQYNATYTGVTGTHLDCNEFQGTREQLLALGTPQEKVVPEIKKEVLQRTDGFMAPIKAEWLNDKDGGAGIPYKLAMWAYNPDNKKHYYSEWVEGEYQPWVEL